MSIWHDAVCRCEADSATAEGDNDDDGDEGVDDDNDDEGGDDSDDGGVEGGDDGGGGGGGDDNRPVQFSAVQRLVDYLPNGLTVKRQVATLISILPH